MPFLVNTSQSQMLLKVKGFQIRAWDAVLFAIWRIYAAPDAYRQSSFDTEWAEHDVFCDYVVAPPLCRYAISCDTSFDIVDEPVHATSDWVRIAHGPSPV